MNAKLTPRQAAFVREYLVDLSATSAAARAGYSAKTAHSSGPRLLANVGVAAAIAAAQAKRAAKVEITAEKVLGELAGIGFAEGSEPEPGAVRVRALELVGKHLGMFTEKLDLTVTALTPDQKAERVREILVRASERSSK